MTKQVEIMVAYTDDVDAAVKMSKQYWAGTMIFATHLQNIYTPEMVAANGAFVGADVIKNRQCISSNPEVHAKFAQRFIDAGFNRVYFYSASPAQYEFIEGYGRDVLPIIREKNRPRAVVVFERAAVQSAREPQQHCLAARNAIIAMGLRKYGFINQMSLLFTGCTRWSERSRTIGCRELNGKN